MTVAIPLRKQSNYNELRFSLRSLERHHPDTQVMIIGPTLPDWIGEVQHIDHPDAKDYEWKSKNIFDKTLAAFQHTDRLLFLNDDHILLAPVDYYHHKGPLIDNINSRNPIGTYTFTLRNTHDVYGDVMDFDTHCPIWYDKDKFLPLADMDWSKPHGYGIKTSYCALNRIEGEFYPDLKFMSHVAQADLIDRLYFSVDDKCDLSALKNIFPNKSRFEK